MAVLLVFEDELVLLGAMAKLVEEQWTFLYTNLWVDCLGQPTNAKDPNGRWTGGITVEDEAFYGSDLHDLLEDRCSHFDNRYFTPEDVNVGSQVQSDSAAG